MIEAIAIIMKILDLAVAGSLTYERIVALRQQIRDMQAEGRDPTVEEFTAILDAIEADTAAIAAADDRLNP